MKIEKVFLRHAPLLPTPFVFICVLSSKPLYVSGLPNHKGTREGERQSFESTANKKTEKSGRGTNTCYIENKG